jgi:hypothetical protein
LDSFAGSATTLVVAKQHACHVIGFEKDGRFYEMAKARLEAEQLDLAFDAPTDEHAIVTELDCLMNVELAIPRIGSAANLCNANLA